MLPPGPGVRSAPSTGGRPRGESAATAESTTCGNFRLLQRLARGTRPRSRLVSIEQTTERSVNAIKKIAPAIEQLSEVANDVAVGMRQQDAVTQEIARNAGAAAKGTRDVSENITEVSNSAIKTGQIASTVLTAAAELADQSHLLRREVERYLAQLRVAS